MKCDDITELIDAFDTVMLGYIGLVSKIFHVINVSQTLSVDGIADALGYELAYVDAYCKVAFLYGLLNETEEGYALSKLTLEQILGREGYSVVFRGHRAYILSLLPRILTGDEETIEEKPYIQTLESRGSSSLTLGLALTALKQNCTSLTQGCKILDLGTGQGAYLVELMKLYPGSSAIGVEKNDELVREIQIQLMRDGMDKRTRIICEDVRNFEPSQSFDLVLMNNILHYLKREERLGLIRKSYRWLRNGGDIAILDQPMPETPERLKKYKRRALLDFEFRVVHGTSLPTLKEIAEVLAQSGFKNIKTTEIGAKGTSIYVIAKKQE